MRHIKLVIPLLLSVLLHATYCQAQGIYTNPTEDDSYGDSYTVNNDFRAEQRRVRVVRERSKIIYEEEAARREQLRTRDYESTVNRNENRNSIDTLTDITQTVTQAFGTVGYVRRIFGNTDR